MKSSLSRRSFFTLAGGAALLVPLARRLAAGETPARPHGAEPTDKGVTGASAPDSGELGYRPLVTPNGAPPNQADALSLTP